MGQFYHEALRGTIHQRAYVPALTHGKTRRRSGSEYTMTDTPGTTLYLVRPDSLDAAWPHAEPWITKALSRADCVSPEACRAFIAEGKWHLFIAMGEGCEAVCVAEIQQYPLRKVLSIYVCTGKNHARWIKHLDQIEAWAKDQGCSRVVAFARKGWAKLLPKYHSTHIILELDL